MLTDQELELLRKLKTHAAILRKLFVASFGASSYFMLVLLDFDTVMSVIVNADLWYYNDRHVGCLQ